MDFGSACGRYLSWQTSRFSFIFTIFTNFYKQMNNSTETPAVESQSAPIHLLVLQHGLHGTILDLVYAKKMFDKYYGETVITV
jgi:hypothetical protein